VPVTLAAGQADGLFQSLSNCFDTSSAAAPTASTSRSAKTTPLPTPKYWPQDALRSPGAAVSP
jgi:hypothetical protein